MKVQFRRSFLKDIRGRLDKSLRGRIKAAIAQVEAAQTLGEINSIKKLKGSENYYRIRIGDYRLALICKEGTATFVRCLDRREIYRYLP